MRSCKTPVWRKPLREGEVIACGPGGCRGFSSAAVPKMPAFASGRGAYDGSRGTGFPSLATRGPRMSKRQVTWLIMGGVAAWGVLLAIGARHTRAFTVSNARLIVVLVCVGLFLGGWGLLLARWKRRT